jgi:hypothetical protein
MLDDDGAVLLVAKVHAPHLDYLDRGPIAELCHDDNRDAASCVVVYHVYLLTCLFASCGGCCLVRREGERERGRGELLLLP